MNIHSISNYSSPSNYLNNRTNSLKQDEPTIVNKPEQISFRAKETNLGKWISKFFGKHYAKPMSDKVWVQKFSEKIKKLPGETTEHMATLGSFLTSGVYMYQTLHNKNLDPDKRKTLTLNQGLCCIIPAVLAYTVAGGIRKASKKLEYSYRGKKDQQLALGRISAERAQQLKESMGNKLKGFKTLSSLLTFTLIYRYLTPVAVTPVANGVGNRMKARKEAKMLAAQKPKEAAMSTNNQVKDMTQTKDTLADSTVKIDEQAESSKNEKLIA